MNVPFETATVCLGALLSRFRDTVLATLALDLKRELPGPESLECHEDLRACFDYGVLGMRQCAVDDAILNVESVLNLFAAPSNDLCRRILVAARARQTLDAPDSPLTPGFLTLDEAHFGRLSELDGSVRLGDLLAAARTWGLDPCEFATAAAAALSDAVR